DSCGKWYGREKYDGAPVVSDRNAPPILESADHDHRLVSSLGGQASNDAIEHTDPAPVLPTVVERLCRAVFVSAQAIAIYEYYARQNTAINKVRATAGLLKNGSRRAIS